MSLSSVKQLQPTVSPIQWLLKVHCGLFGVSEDFSEAFQSLDERFVQSRESTFFFEAAGSSMEPLIFPGDVLIVDRSVRDHHDKICVVAYEDELICKRVIIGKGHLILRSENNKFKDIVVYDSHTALVWGVVTARCGRLR